jgi:hypothetical protein
MVFVGKIAEELFGTARTFAIFGVAGFSGAVASYLASPAGISAGASGALFGLLGAVCVELTWHRRRYRAVWKRGIGWALVIVIAAQVVYGFVYPVIDQWAHGAGLVAGAAIGAVLSPHARWVKAGLQLARAVATVAVVFFVIAGIRVARTSIYDSFWRLPRYGQNVGGVSIAAPAAWLNDGELSEPDGLVIVSVRKSPAVDTTKQIAMWIAADVPAQTKSRGFETVEAAIEPSVKLPKGWEGSELVATFSDPMGYRQRYRLIACGKVFGDTLVTVAITTPETIATAAQPFLGFLLSSMTIKTP